MLGILVPMRSLLRLLKPFPRNRRWFRGILCLKCLAVVVSVTLLRLTLTDRLLGVMWWVSLIARLVFLSA